MPEAGTVGFYSDWRGSRGQGGPAWESFHLDELRGLLERRYRAGPRRAVAGLSMGGLGAIGYAARRPGLFRAAASFSGLLHPLQDAALLLGAISAYTPNPRAIGATPTPTARPGRVTSRPSSPSAGRAWLFVSPATAAPGRWMSPPGADMIEATVLGQSRAFVKRLAQLNIPVH